MNLSENENRVLEYLCQDGELAWHFAPICQDLNMNRNEVRSACRSLRDKGMARFCRGLMDEDGQLAGSGYSATREGEQTFAYMLEHT